MIDHVVCAKFACALSFAIVAGSRNHPAMKQFGNLNSGDANAGVGAQHEDRLPRLNASAAHEHVPSRGEHQRDAGGFVKTQRVWNRNNVYSRNRDQFAIAAIHRISKYGKFAALILQAGGTLLAMIAKMHRSKQHPLAGLETGNVLANLDDLSCDIAAENMRQL